MSGVGFQLVDRFLARPEQSLHHRYARLWITLDGRCAHEPARPDGEIVGQVAQVRFWPAFMSPRRGVCQMYLTRNPAQSKAISHLCLLPPGSPCVTSPLQSISADPSQESRTFLVQPPPQQPFLLNSTSKTAICCQGGGLAGIKRPSKPLLGDCHRNKVLCSCSVVLFLSFRRGEPPGDRTFVPFHSPRKGKYGPKAHFIALPVW